MATATTTTTPNRLLDFPSSNTTTYKHTDALIVDHIDDAVLEHSPSTVPDGDSTALDKPATGTPAAQHVQEHGGNDRDAEYGAERHRQGRHQHRTWLHYTELPFPLLSSYSTTYNEQSRTLPGKLHNNDKDRKIKMDFLLSFYETLPTDNVTTTTILSTDNFTCEAPAFIEISLDPDDITTLTYPLANLPRPEIINSSATSLSCDCRYERPRPRTLTGQPRRRTLHIRWTQWTPLLATRTPRTTGDAPQTDVDWTSSRLRLLQLRTTQLFSNLQTCKDAELLRRAAPRATSSSTPSQRAASTQYYQLQGVFSTSSFPLELPDTHTTTDTTTNYYQLTGVFSTRSFPLYQKHDTNTTTLHHLAPVKSKGGC